VLEKELQQRMGNAIRLDLLPELEIPDQLKDMQEKPAGGRGQPSGVCPKRRQASSERRSVSQ
jgi:hypothetical protein